MLSISSRDKETRKRFDRAGLTWSGWPILAARNSPNSGVPGCGPAAQACGRGPFRPEDGAGAGTGSVCPFGDPVRAMPYTKVVRIVPDFTFPISALFQ